MMGGILQCALMVLFPNHFAPFVFGASAGAAGIFAIFVLLLPDTEVRWNFILPVPAMALLWITGAISLFFTIVPSHRGGDVAHAAHLGGILAGIAWVKLGWHRDFIQLPWEGWFSGRKLFSRRNQTSDSAKAATSFKIPGVSKPDSTDLPSEEFISREVDPIL